MFYDGLNLIGDLEMKDIKDIEFELERLGRKDRKTSEDKKAVYRLRMELIELKKGKNNGHYK